MRILFLTPTIGKQGTWFRCVNLGEQLALLGHKVTLVRLGRQRFLPEVHHESGIRVVDSPRFFGNRLSHGETRLPSDLLTRVGLVLTEQFDVIHTFTHFTNVVLPGAFARFVAHPRPVLVADWDDLYTDGGLSAEPPWSQPLSRINYLIDSRSERSFKRLADAVTVVSADLIERSVSHGVARPKVHLIPNGAPIDAVRPMPVEEARKRLSLPLDRKIVLFSGFTTWDVDLILEALLYIDREMNVLALFTGYGKEETLRLAAQRGLSDRVRVDGFVPFESVPLYMCAADVGLIPFSDKAVNRARWPIKLGDYLAAGLPIATHDVGEMGRFVAKWRVGVATACDALAYARGISELLRGDPVKLRARAREVALQTSWHVAAKMLEQLYSTTIQRREATRDRP